MLRTTDSPYFDRAKGSVAKALPLPLAPNYGLAKVFQMEAGEALGIYGEPYTGKTSVALLLAEYWDACHIGPAVFVGLADGLVGVSPAPAPSLAVLRPTALHHIGQAALELKAKNALLVIDSADLLERIGLPVLESHSFLQQLMGYCSVILTSRGKPARWRTKTSVHLSLFKSYYDERTPTAASIVAKSEVGEGRFAVNWRTRRVSHAYDDAIYQLDCGTDRSGTFKSGHVEEAGINNFLRVAFQEGL